MFQEHRDACVCVCVKLYLVHTFCIHSSCGVRSPAEAKDFSSSLCVETSSGAHPASCSMGTGGPFPGAEVRPGHDADLSLPSSAESRMSRGYILSPLAPSWRSGAALLLLYLHIQWVCKTIWCGCQSCFITACLLAKGSLTILNKQLLSLTNGSVV
jgi:hypothetical protein